MDQRAIPEECAIALVYDGTTAAVVMATPADLTDLAIGFSVTEGIIETASEIEDLNVVQALTESNFECGSSPAVARSSRSDSVAS